jgi:hypothetical protein
LVKDINTDGTDSNISRLTPFGGKVYFTACDSPNGTELWISDGSEGGTV